MAMPDDRPADKGGPMPDDEPRPDRATLEGTLDGRSFRLRPARTDDAPALVQHWDDPDVRRFLFDGQPVGTPMVEALLAELRPSGPDDTAVGLWVLELPDDPGSADDEPPVAMAGTLALRRCSQPTLAAVELVYSLHPAHWGHGLVTAAGRLLIGHAFA